MNNEEIIRIIKKAISEKKGHEVAVIDVRKRTPFVSYYILSTANNPRQINAIKEAVVDALEKNKIKYNHIEGKVNSGWVLIDAYQYLINIFSKEERKRFDLDSLLKEKNINY